MARSLFFKGIRDISPIMLGVIPFGTIAGVATVNAGLSEVAGVGMSTIVFAGASQLVGLQLISTSTPIFIIWLSTFMINLRFMIYSGSLAPHFVHLPNRWKFLLAYLLTDQAYAMSIVEYDKSEIEPAHKHWYYLGTAVALWVVWQITTLIGIFLGAQIPASWSLDFAIPLTFMALLFFSLADRSTWVAAAVGGIMAVLLSNLPFNAGLIVAALIGIVAGTISSRHKQA